MIKIIVEIDNGEVNANTHYPDRTDNLICRKATLENCTKLGEDIFAVAHGYQNIHWLMLDRAHDPDSPFKHLVFKTPDPYK